MGYVVSKAMFLSLFRENSNYTRAKGRLSANGRPSPQKQRTEATLRKLANTKVIKMGALCFSSTVLSQGLRKQPLQHNDLNMQLYM